jgi:hypothetical protein
MVRVLACNAVDPVFKLGFGQIKDYQFDICCFSTKTLALRSKSKDLFGWESE